MSQALPYNLENLAGAAARAFLIPRAGLASLPEKASDIFAQKSPYTKATGVIEVGATSAPLQTSRNIATAGTTIEQSQTPLLEEVTELTHTVQITFAELRPEILKIINGGVTETLSAGAADGSGIKTRFGNITDLDHFVVAFMVRRKKAQGVVKEGSGAGAITRGRHLIYVGYDATLQAENVQANFGKGQVAAFQTTFKLYPDASKPEGQEHGYWIDEDAQTLS